MWIYGRVLKMATSFNFLITNYNHVTIIKTDQTYKVVQTKFKRDFKVKEITIMFKVSFNDLVLKFPKVFPKNTKQWIDYILND